MGASERTADGATVVAAPSAVTVTIPGEPCAQGRPRMAVVNGFARAYDPKKSRLWKGVAQMFMRDAMRERAPLEGPLYVEVVATWTCPSSAPKRIAAERHLRAKRPDAENVAKAVMDAGNGVLWIDDAQVARLVVEKWTGARGEAPGVRVTVMRVGAA